MKLTIQIVNFRSRDFLEKCLFSLMENLPPDIRSEVLVINNDENPLNDTKNIFEKNLSLRILEVGKNIGFGKAHNRGFVLSRGEYILFLNPDAQVLPGAVLSMVNLLERDKKIGAVGPFLVNGYNELQSESFGLQKKPASTLQKKLKGSERINIEQKKPFEMDWVSGGAMLVRRKAFQQVGRFDEKYFMYFEDVDLCLQMKKIGFKIVVNPAARIYHAGGKSFKEKKVKKRYYYISQDYYFRKNFGSFKAGLIKLLRFPLYIKNVYFG